ncbi:MAG: hypothetical protein ACLSHC_09030 [Bilophila wadsworthia]
MGGRGASRQFRDPRQLERLTKAGIEIRHGLALSIWSACLPGIEARCRRFGRDAVYRRCGRGIQWADLVLYRAGRRP